jgi:hypothetical protein
MPDLTQAGDVSAEALEARIRELPLQLLMTKASNILRAYDTDLRDFHAYDLDDRLRHGGGSCGNRKDTTYGLAALWVSRNSAQF